MKPEVFNYLLDTLKQCHTLFSKPEENQKISFESMCQLFIMLDKHEEMMDQLRAIERGRST